jgi:hypothetical protein
MIRQFLLASLFLTAIVHGNAFGNLVTNPGFEEGIGSPWWNNGEAGYYCDNASHSGSRSLKMQVSDPGKRALVGQSVSVIPGESYDIGVWIKAENVTSNAADHGAQIIIEWSGPSGWLGGEWKAKKIKGTVEDWLYSGAMGVKIPEEATSANVYLQMTSGATGTAWFDDVVMERTPKALMETFVLRPNYRGKIFPEAASPEIEVEVSLHPEEHGLTLEELGIVAALNQNGTSIVETDLGSLSSGTFRLDLDVPTDTTAGDYELRIALYRAGAGELAEPTTYPIEILSEADLSALTSYVDAHNRFILNGEPFFPLGLYVAQCSISDQSSQLDEIENSPFDTLMNYNINKCGSLDATNSEIRDYLDELCKRDLKLIFRLYDYVSHDPSDIVTLREKVETFKDHPAVLSWHMSEEGGPDGALDYVPAFEARYDTIRELDDNHPVWSVHTRKYVFMGEAHTTDILGVDPYPIPNHPINMFSCWADWAKEAGRGYKPLWLVGQIFGWAGRPPTKAEMRAMTYLATNHGAKGLIYYAYFAILDQGGNPDPGQWAAIKEVASEIRNLRPIFLSTDQTDSIVVDCNHDNIDFKLMREGNAYHLFAVNTKKEAVTDISFHIPTALNAQVVDVLFEDGRQKSADEEGSFLDDFDPYEVHVYHWITAPAVSTKEASSVTSVSAELNGTVNPNGEDTTYFFEYGEDSSYGTSSPPEEAGLGTSDVSVSADVSGLSKNTTYHFRLVAVNSGGTTYGQDMILKTNGDGGGGGGGGCFISSGAD